MRAWGTRVPRLRGFWALCHMQGSRHEVVGGKEHDDVTCWVRRCTRVRGFWVRMGY